MSTRAQFDEVADSLRNGQRKQAYRQMREIGLNYLPEMLDYFSADLADADLALTAAKTYFRNAAKRHRR